jgi:hypothetical protein
VVVRSDNGSGAFLFARSRRGLPIVLAYVRYTICRHAGCGATGCIYSPSASSEVIVYAAGRGLRPGQKFLSWERAVRRGGRPNPAESKPRRLPGLDERTVGIEFADLRLKDHSILVAGGSSKVYAIFDALRQLREYIGNRSDYGESVVGKLDLQKILNI